MQENPMREFYLTSDLSRARREFRSFTRKDASALREWVADQLQLVNDRRTVSRDIFSGDLSAHRDPRSMLRYASAGI